MTENNNKDNMANTKTDQRSDPSMIQRETRPSWLSRLKPFEKPDTKKVLLQIANTLLPYLGGLVLMYFTVRWGMPVWVTLILAVPVAGLLVRMFIFFHDCCHGSYLASKRAMSTLGTIFGILAFTPFTDWRHSHGIHHSSSGNLDRRGIGDVWTMTREEYESSSKWIRLKYRVFRNPVVMFGIGPLMLFLFSNRIPGKYSTVADRRSIVFTNLSLLLIFALTTATLGIEAYLLIQLPVIYFASVIGIWLFYVQHQFDPSYWARNDKWESFEAALSGSSYYKLPAILRWYSGSIGLHHIHHLKPRIPNYNLKACLNAVPELQLKRPLTIRRSLKAVRLNLWDEKREMLIPFRALRTQRA